MVGMCCSGQHLKMSACDYTVTVTVRSGKGHYEEDVGWAVFRLSRSEY